MSEVVIILSTVPDDASAETIARTLVEERLAACANLLPPMASFYRWKGKVERDTERQLVMKTTRSRVEALKTRLRELHSYELAEFIILPIEGGDKEYLKWIAGETA